MYIKAVPNRDSPPAILLRESYRDGGKAGTHVTMGTGRSLSSGRPKAGPVGRCDENVRVFQRRCRWGLGS